MTTVTFEKDGDGQYRSFTCFGHAGFARKKAGRYEPDILCAAITALTANTINGLSELAGENVTVTKNDEDAFVRCEINSPLKESSILLVDAYLMSLREYEKDYGKNLKVIVKEVI